MNAKATSFFPVDLQVVPRTEKFYFNNCKIANYLPMESNLEDSFPLEIMPVRNKNVKIIVDITGEDNIHLSDTRITLFDMAVMDAAYTLYSYECKEFTPEMVVRIMACKMDLDVTKQKKAAVINSLEKLRNINIEIDCTNEFRERGYIKKDDDSRCILKSYLLPLNVITVTPAYHSELMKGYKFIATPALYDYAEYINQIINADMEILRIDGISMTEEVIVLRNYLFKRISSMKNSKSRIASNHIVYERDGGRKGLMPALGYGVDYKKNKPKYYNRKKSAIHAKAIYILDSFQKKGFIKGYEVIKKRDVGGAIYGFAIIL